MIKNYHALDREGVSTCIFILVCLAANKYKNARTHTLPVQCVVIFYHLNVVFLVLCLY